MPIFAENCCFAWIAPLQRQIRRVEMKCTSVDPHVGQDTGVEC